MSAEDPSVSGRFRSTRSRRTRRLRICPPLFGIAARGILWLISITSHRQSPKCQSNTTKREKLRFPSMPEYEASSTLRGRTQFCDT